MCEKKKKKKENMRRNYIYYLLLSYYYYRVNENCLLACRVYIVKFHKIAFKSHSR